MNIGCESGVEQTDIAFFENAAGQEVDHYFNGPGASCNILTKTWFWRTSDTKMELRTADWALEKIIECNKHNVSFLLNGAPNQQGLLDENVLQRFKEVGEQYHQPANLTMIPENWSYRK
jgi:alpha-L-fucosidase